MCNDVARNPATHANVRNKPFGLPDTEVVSRTVSNFGTPGCQTRDLNETVMTMLTRRTLLTSSIAAGALAPVAGLAQSGYVFPEAFMPQVLRLAEPFAPGEIHVLPNEFGLYWSLPGHEDGTTIRYSVGIGRAGLYESGEFFVGAKKEWPSWTPTQEMIERDPASYEQYEDGMPGGPNNPLGARALYLFEPGRGDTFLRIHGTTAPRTIGRAVSNGCVRLVNSHIMHLYDQVPQGTRVVLH